MPRAFSQTFPRWTTIAFLAMMLSPLALTGSALPSAAPEAHLAITSTPEVDPHFIYTQLDYMATHFQKREAGYDTNLPPDLNGHDEFAHYWTQQMLSLLGSYGAEVRNDPFPIQGWQGRPTTVPAFNVEITVPGIVHPEQIVVIGCHYDGMAFSTQSANDDASGCAIELGVAKAMSEFWTKNHVYPARTLRFVIFDAEESGLFGSYHYVNATSNGDLFNIVAMFNEEQNGINYPLRYLGNMSNPLMPYYIDMAPLLSNSLYNQSKLTTQQRAHISEFRQLMGQAVVASFQEFRAMGDQVLTYHVSTKQDVWQPIFTSDQLSNIHLEDDALGSSDQMPFTMAGLPCATLVGNSTYYDPNAPPGSYPYDQPGDTIQLMNTFADGTAAQSQALTLALGLPGMITSWMLSQPAILGQASADGKPLAAINSLGQTRPNQAIQFTAESTYDPAQSNTPFNYHWNFGDGANATGQTVSHTYTQAGTYTLSLTVSASDGNARTITQQLIIGQPTTYVNPYAGYASNGMPPASSSVVLPISTNGPADRVGTTADTTHQGGPMTNGGSLKRAETHATPSFPWLWFLSGLVIIIIVVIAILLRIRRVRSI